MDKPRLAAVDIGTNSFHLVIVEADTATGKFKILGQVGLGIIIGFTLYFNPNVVVREKMASNEIKVERETKNIVEDLRKYDNYLYSPENMKSTKTTIPFYKNNEFDYAKLISFVGPNYKKFKEAVDLIKLGGAFAVADNNQATRVLNEILNDEKKSSQFSSISSEYVNSKIGATDRILASIKQDELILK